MRYFRSVWIFVALAVVGIFSYFATRPKPLKPMAGQGIGHSPSGEASSDIRVRAGDPLGVVFEQLAATPDSLRTLSDLQAELSEMEPAEAAKWIRDFLKSGKDKPTGLIFEIGADHSLKQWPTFRTFLLDTLRAIDPAAAAEISREILSQPSTADEWALALRNIGLIDDSSDTRAMLARKTEELIANPAWQTNPSVGYLNAFDVLVHTKALGSTPTLSALIQRKDRKDLVHASFLTLDRLVQQEPAEMLTRIVADKALQQSRPEMTAQQFARADLRDPTQQALVKSWLLDPSRTGTELTSFAGIYPNNNQFVSNNLLTKSAPQSGVELMAHDRAALEILNSWSADPAFTPVKEYLGTMVSRLNGFVANPAE